MTGIITLVSWYAVVEDGSSILRSITHEPSNPKSGRTRTV